MDDQHNGQSHNGRQPHSNRFRWQDWPHETAQDAASDSSEFDLLAQDDETASEREEGESSASGWVSAGGVLEWAEPEEASDPAAEAQSPLANEDLTMPEGAPPGPRLRAVHAWLARRRLTEQEALGALLLAQREQRQDADREQPGPRRRRSEPQASPLDLALAEHQASADEYDTLLSALDDLVAHTGPQRALVEFYLWLGEHLAQLAADPDAADSGGPAVNPGQASWLGRAQAALATRIRVEQMTAPAEDD
jgi:hypothetical protein